MMANLERFKNYIQTGKLVSGMGCSCVPEYLGSLDFKIEKSNDYKGLCNNYFCLKFTYNHCIEAVTVYRLSNYGDVLVGFKEPLRASPGGEVVGTSITYVLPPGEYLAVYARYITPLCGEAIADAILRAQSRGINTTGMLLRNIVGDLAVLGIYPAEASIKRFKVVDANHAETIDTWVCNGDECKKILHVINRMRWGD
jgi:hypothetical protein